MGALAVLAFASAATHEAFSWRSRPAPQALLATTSLRSQAAGVTAAGLRWVVGDARRPPATLTQEFERSLAELLAGHDRTFRRQGGRPLPTTLAPYEADARRTLTRLHSAGVGLLALPGGVQGPTGPVLERLDGLIDATEVYAAGLDRMRRAMELDARRAELAHVLAGRVALGASALLLVSILLGATDRWLRGAGTTDRLVVANSALAVAVAESRQFARSLRESSGLTNAVFETAADAIVVIDERGVIHRANDAAAAMFGVPATGLVGTNITRFMPPDQRTRHPDYVAAALGTGRRGVLRKARKILATRADGSEFPAELSVSRVDVEGIVLFTGIVRDVTEREALEEQLARARKLESLGQLAAGIAHEINTPMQCVAGNTEFLQGCLQSIFRVMEAFRANAGAPGDPLVDRREEHRALAREARLDHVLREAPLAVAETAEAAARVIEIVRAMKAMSHPGARDKAPYDLNELVRHAATLSRNRWRQVAELRFELSHDLPELEGHAVELSQVVLNLIVNAADAIAEKWGDENLPTGSPLGCITVRTSVTLNGVQLEVEDDGVGMSEEVRLRAFDPFYTTKQVGKGTGQGLAIAHEVVTNMHGGVIDVLSTPGEGTLFVVSLPCGVAAATQPEEAAQA